MAELSELMRLHLMALRSEIDAVLLADAAGEALEDPIVATTLGGERIVLCEHPAEARVPAAVRGDLGRFLCRRCHQIVSEPVAADVG